MRLPITPTIAWFLLLQHFHAPEWLWGVMGFIFVILWLVTFYAMWIQQPVRLKELSEDKA